MNIEKINKAYQEEKKTYAKNFKKSAKKHKELCKYMPGGNTKSLSFFSPFPVHIKKGKGAYVYSTDGNKLLDVVNAYGALIHGHADNRIITSINLSIENGTQFASPSDAQYKLSKMLCKRVKSVEKVRFCNSGTEATLFAMRAARAYKNKEKIVKIKGGYHGTHDAVARATDVQSVMSGIPSSMTNDIIEISYNNFEEAQIILTLLKEQIAAVIIEPFLGAGGIIAPQNGYLEHIRKLTTENNILLIFDEILSFRIHKAGAQAYYGVEPDITAFGKIIGGGLAIGAFGGKTEIMNIFDHTACKKPVFHSGTFNGYDTALNAGYTALEKYDKKEITKLNKKGEYIYKKLNKVIEKENLKIKITQVGSFLNIHFVEEEVINNEIAMKSNQDALSLLHIALINKGIYSTPRGLIVLSTAMTKKDIEFIVKTYTKIFTKYFKN